MPQGKHASRSIFTPSYRGGSGPPLLCIHGFIDTWRTWELVLPVLERHHEVLAPTLAGHAGGAPLEGEIGVVALADAVERALDEAGWGAVHVVGNSLGGYVALQLASRGRAKTVVALAPAGGFAPGDDSYRETLDLFETIIDAVRAAAPRATAIVASPGGPRRVTEYTVTNFEHIPLDLLAHRICGAASCDAGLPLLEEAHRVGWPLDAESIACPVRVVWGTSDRILPWPRAAARYRDELLGHADWVELEGIGHQPQLDVPLETAQLILETTSR
jgi:pimeloyl-ACP methyl ester carboxylesterase